MRKSALKTVLVVCGAVACSTLGIFAADSIRGIDGNLAQLITADPTSVCGEHAIVTRIGDYMMCIDRYEASPGPDCTHKNPISTLQSEQNLSNTACGAQSLPAVTPWTHISLAQAQRACASVGKRLPTADEWYRIALGTPHDACVIDARGTQKTGTEGCVSAIGAYDSIGNVWEWVDAQVIDAAYDGRTLPETGYVVSVDMHGVALQTQEVGDELHGKDYFWSSTSGVFGIIRGGFYGSGDDAGLYAVNASVPTTFAAQGVGFRCVRDIM